MPSVQPSSKSRSTSGITHSAGLFEVCLELGQMFGAHFAPLIFNEWGHELHPSGAGVAPSQSQHGCPNPQPQTAWCRQDPAVRSGSPIQRLADADRHSCVIATFAKTGRTGASRYRLTRRLVGRQRSGSSSCPATPDDGRTVRRSRTLLRSASRRSRYAES